MTVMNDTHPAAEAVLNDLLQQAPVWRKLELMVQLNATGRALALSDLRRRFPDASEAFIERQLAERMLGKQLADAVMASRSSAGEQVYVD